MRALILGVLTIALGTVELFGAATPAINSLQWTSVSGLVIWPNSEEIPKKVIDVMIDKKHCLSNGPIVDEAIVVHPKNRGVKNVVVWLRPESKDRKSQFPKNRIHPDLVTPAPKNHIVDSPCCQYVPRIVAARVSNTVEFKNSSPINHNISYASDTFPLGLPFPPHGSRKTCPLELSQPVIPFKCDIHPWMAGRVRVFDHPYFTVTNDDGSFTIPNTPTGKWRIVYWHENGYHRGQEGVLGFPIELKPEKLNTLPTIELELPE
jgi:plastocyanin